MNHYRVDIDIDKDIPTDVLTEHIGAALRSFRTEAVPATAPRVTVRKLANGGIVGPAPLNGDNIVYNPGTSGYPLLGDVAQALGVDKLIEYTKSLPRLYDNFNGAVPKQRQQGRDHPFEGPEVWDDEPKPLKYPKLDELLADKFAEGDWDLDGGEHVGDDL